LIEGARLDLCGNESISLAFFNGVINVAIEQGVFWNHRRIRE